MLATCRLFHYSLAPTTQLAYKCIETSAADLMNTFLWSCQSSVAQYSGHTIKVKLAWWDADISFLPYLTSSVLHTQLRTRANAQGEKVRWWATPLPSSRALPITHSHVGGSWQAIPVHTSFQDSWRELLATTGINYCLPNKNNEVLLHNSTK